MKKIYLLILLFVCILILKPHEKTPNDNPQQTWLEKLTAENMAQQQRVVQYLQANPETPVRYTKAQGQIATLYDIIKGKPFYLEAHNANSAAASRINSLHTGDFNLDGSGMVIGYWDNTGSPNSAHLEFIDDSDPQNPFSRVNVVEQNNEEKISTHASNVVGTIAAKGVDASAKGMAPAATVKSYIGGLSLSDDPTQTQDEVVEVFNEINAAQDPIILSYHSYGGEYTNTAEDAWRMGAYTSKSSQWDALMYDHPTYLHINSAGNNGSQSNNVDGLLAGSVYDKLTAMGTTSKNNIVVATSDNPSFNSNGNFDGDIRPNSSQGPTDDLRIKPDITTDGDQVRSTAKNTTGYRGNSGNFSSSSAGAVVAGAAALLQQYHNNETQGFMWGSSLKGVMLHTATDDVLNPGPDPHFGWGFLDAQKAADIIKKGLDSNDNTVVLEENSLVEGTTDTYSISFTADAGAEVRATICWTDPAGTAVADGTSNSAAALLVNDLDLLITSSGDTDYHPWRLEIDQNAVVATKGVNSKDPIERIDFVSPATDTYTLTVSYVDDLDNNGNGQEGDRQDYSLIVSGITNFATLSKESVTGDSTFLVYPSPSYDESFFVEYGSSVSELSVHSIDGREVHRVVLPTSQRKEKISLDGIGPGVYFVRLDTAHQTEVKKWVVR